MDSANSLVRVAWELIWRFVGSYGALPFWACGFAWMALAFLGGERGQVIASGICLIYKTATPASQLFLL